MADVAIRAVSGKNRTTLGTQDFTVSGFGTPKAAIVISGNAKNTSGTVTTTAQMSMCFTDGTNHYGISEWGIHGSANTALKKAMFTDRAIFTLQNSGVDGEVIFDSWVTDGVRLEWTNTWGDGDVEVIVILIAGDDTEVEVGSVELNDNSGTPLDNPEAVDVGFRPNVVFTLTNGEETPTNRAIVTFGMMALGIAVDDGSETQRALSFWEFGSTFARVGGSGGPNLGWETNNSELNSNPTAELTTFASDGFSVASGFKSGTGPEVGFMALRFGTRDVSLDVLDTPTSTGVESYDVGLEPEFVFTLQSQWDDDWVGDHNYQDAKAGVVGFGFQNETEGFSYLWMSRNGNTFSFTNTAALSGMLLGRTHDGSANYQGTLDSFDADGFDIDYSAASTLAQFVALTIGAETGVSGNITGFLPLLEGAGTGWTGFTATGAGMLPLLTGAATGTQTFSGTGAGMLPGLTGAGTGSLQITGTAAGTLPGLSASGTASQTFSGTGAGTLPALSGAATGWTGFKGAGAGTLPRLTAAAVGTQSFSGAGAGILPLLTGAATGVLTFAATGAGTLPLLTATASGTQTFSGAAAGTLPALTAAGVGKAAFTGVGAGTLPALTGAAAGTAPIFDVDAYTEFNATYIDSTTFNGSP